MKKIFIVPNPNKDVGYNVTRQVARELLLHGAEITILSQYSESNIENCNYSEEFPNDSELIVVIGGDGSFIDASIYAARAEIPIIGINLGKVGYLCEIEPSELTDLSKIFTDDYSIVNKMLLEVDYTSNDGVLHIERHAVNDVVISHPDHLGIADFVVYSKAGGVRYRADGVVISTPQGSTAYSLSAGGPIVSHDTGAVIVTPIAPHSFFNRSIVFAENEEIKIKNTSDSELNVSVDGRLYCKILKNEKCIIRVSDKKIKALTFKSNNMFSKLFSKMQILEDII